MQARRGVILGQAGNTHGDSDCRDAPHTEPSTRCEDTQAGHSRDATAMATAFEPLNRSLETFLTRLSRTNERSEKSRRVFKKPRCYKDESDGCIDTWIEVMKLHFEEEDLSERQECSALTSNLEGTALNCVMAKKQYQRDTPGQSKDFAITTSSEPQTGESRTRGLGNALADPEIDNEKTSRQRVKARISTSTKLPGTDRVTPPLVTPLVDNGAALEEALNNIVDSLGEQNEQMSIRMSELERTDEHMAKNLSRMTREAEQRELRLRDDMERLRIQQEQSLGTLDTNIDAMMERRAQAIMDRLDGLLSSKSGPKEGEPNSGGPSKEPRMNFNEHQKRKTYGSTRGRGSSSGYATRGNGTWGPNSRASSTGNRQTSNERPTQGTHATGRSDSGNRGHASPKRSHIGASGKHSR